MLDNNNGESADTVSREEFHRVQVKLYLYEKEAKEVRRTFAAALGLRGSVTHNDILRKIHNLQDDLQVARAAEEDLCAQNSELVERIGYWERGSTARLLGVTDDQLEAVRGVLRQVYADITHAVASQWLMTAYHAWSKAGQPLLPDASNDRAVATTLELEQKETK